MSLPQKAGVTYYPTANFVAGDCSRATPIFPQWRSWDIGENRVKPWFVIYRRYIHLSVHYPLKTVFWSGWPAYWYSNKWGLVASQSSDYSACLFPIDSRSAYPVYPCHQVKCVSYSGGFEGPNRMRALPYRPIPAGLGPAAIDCAAEALHSCYHLKIWSLGDLKKLQNHMPDHFCRLPGNCRRWSGSISILLTARTVLFSCMHNMGSCSKVNPPAA